MTYEEYCQERPILQAQKTGLWGYGRWGNGFNLNSARHRSYLEADSWRRDQWQDDEDVEAAITAGKDPRTVPLRIDARERAITKARS